MENLEKSVFWNKAKLHMTAKALTMESLARPDQFSELVHIRRITHFTLLEGPFRVSTPEEAFLFDRRTLRVLKVDPAMAQQSLRPDVRSYLLAALDPTVLDRYPPSVEFGTTSTCNRSCASCIQGHQDMGKYQASESHWTSFVSQLSLHCASTPDQDHPVVHLHWYNEPLLDPRIGERLRDLRLAGVDNVVFMTNGDSLTDAKLDEVADLTQLCIIAAKSDRIYRRYNQFNLSARNVVCLDHGRYNRTIHGYNRCGSVPLTAGSRRPRCTRGFNIQIDHDGAIYLCANDMGRSHSYGHLDHNNVFEVWNSEPLVTWRVQLDSGQFTRNPCALCTHDYS